MMKKAAIMYTNFKTYLFIVFGLISLFGSVLAVSQTQIEEISGQFEDGTYWLAMKPENWNGTLLLNLDGAGYRSGNAVPVRRIRAFEQWLFRQGYAMGGITREPVSYDFIQAGAYLMDVRDLFIREWEEPARTLAVGTSRGAFAVRMNLELYPEIFDGGFMTAGGGGGEIAVLNNKLNSVFVMKTLVNPDSPMRLVNIDTQAENAAWAALVDEANATAQGRARLAFSAAMQQLATWAVPGAAKPEAGDYEAQLDQIAQVMAFATAIPVRGGIENIARGNVSWNTDADYEDLLNRSGRREMVEYFYLQAGLSLEDDLATLANTPRISANAGAIRRIEPMMTYSGRIQDPLVNLDNDDVVDPAPDKLAYLDTLRNAGSDHLFRLIWTDIAGHATHSGLEMAVGFSLLIDRIDSGQWKDISLPSLYALATEIQAANTDLDMGEVHFFNPGPLPQPLNSWDISSWGSYQPK
jgi:hypothetical protein